LRYQQKLFSILQNDEKEREKRIDAWKTRKDE
jgi:hypothetical protein